MPGTATTEKREAAATALAQMADRALPTYVGTPAEKDVTLSQYARMWLAGMEGSLSVGLHEPLTPYRQSLWVYRCIREIQTTGKGIPLRMSREAEGVKYSAKSFTAEIRRTRQRTLRPIPGRKAVCVGKAAEGELIESGPGYDLLSRPNGYQDWPRFFEATIGLFLLRGKVAWIMTDFVGRRPGEIHVIDGRYIKPQWAKDESGMPVLLGYKYTAPKTRQTIPLSTDEVKYFSLWDDTEDPFGGMSPCAPGRLAIATEYNASLYNASSLVNSCEPGITISFPQNLTPDQREEFRANLQQRHRGPTKPKKELILEGGAKAEAFATTMRDLQFNEGKKTTRLEICCLFGVPPVVAGWVEAAGDSSAYTANALRQFYQQTVFPMLDGFAPALQEIVSRIDAGAVVWFDVEDQPVVQEMRMARVDTGEKLWKMSYPINDINRLLDLGMPELPWGDEGLVPIGLQRARDAAAGEVFEPVNEGTSSETSDELDQGRSVPGDKEEARGDEEAAGQITKAARERIWTQWASSVKPLQRIIAKVLRTRYLAQQRLLTKLLKERMPAPADHSARGSSESKDQLLVAEVLFDVFGSGDNRRRFRARMAQFTTDANELGVRQALSEAGLTGTALEDGTRRLLSSPGIVQAVRSDAIRVSTLIDNYTRQLVRDHLAEGLSAGEDVRKLADRVQAVMGNRRAAAMSVARNSVGQALSSSRHAGHLAAGMTHKGWIHSRGPGDRRPGHIEAEHRYMPEPIPLTQPFIINGVPLMYPRDFSAGRPAETVNCQCLQIAKRISGGQRSVTMAELMEAYLARRFYSYHDMLVDRAPEKGSKNEE